MASSKYSNNGFSSQQMPGLCQRDIPVQMGFSSSNTWMTNFSQYQQGNMLHYEDYCKYRSNLQLQLSLNGRVTKMFGADDPIFAGLILMEQQWQYSQRMAMCSPFSKGLLNNGSHPTFNQGGGNSFFNKNFGNKHQRKVSAKKRKITKCEGKPKKPLTSFMLYLRDFRKNYFENTKQADALAPHHVNRLAGKQWHLLPENVKEKYKEEASKAMKNWHNENSSDDKIPCSKNISTEETRPTKGKGMGKDYYLNLSKANCSTSSEQSASYD